MEVTLKAEAGRDRGKSAARALRRRGRVPAVIYGRTVDATPVSVDRRELHTALSTEAGRNVLINLRIDDEKDPHLTLAREIQRDPLRGDLLHVDFVAIRRDQPIEATVPVHLVGEAPAVDKGLIIETHAISVVVSCLPTEVPSVLELSIDELEDVGDAVRASDIEIPDGVLLITDLEESIAVVIPPPVLEIEEEVAEEAEELAEGEEAGEEAAGEAASAEGGAAPAAPGEGARAEGGG